MNNIIPFCQPWILPEEADAVREQVASGWIGPGQKVREFEAALATYVGVQHCICTVSGTVALSLAARIACPFDADPSFFPASVIPAYGVISVPHGISNGLGYPGFMDIERHTGALDPESVLAMSVKGKFPPLLCYVDFSGGIGEAPRTIKAICEAKDSALLEDAACALGREDAGTIGHISITSFAVPKLITTGQGGAIFTNNDEWALQARNWIDLGGDNWRETNLSSQLGTNLRFTDIQAALGLTQLQHIEQRLARKKAAAEALHALLGHRLFITPSGVPLHNIVFTDQPDALVAKLNNQGIQARRQYRTYNQHPCYSHTRGHFPNADWWTDHSVYLPFGLALTPEDGERIARAVLDCGVPLLEAP